MTDDILGPAALRRRLAARWGAVGAAIGVLCGAATLLLTEAATRIDTDNVREPLGGRVVLALIVTVAIGTMVGSGGGSLLPMGITGGAFAVTGAVGAFLFGVVPPLLSGPLVACLLGLQASRSIAVRTIAFFGVLVGVAQLIGVPLAAWWSVTGGSPSLAFLIALASGLGVAILAISIIRPGLPPQAEEAGQAPLPEA